MANVKLRVVTADDEPLARERLRALLSAHADVEVAAECADGRSAVDAIRRLEPDLAILDIQMPEVGGFDVLDALGALRGFDVVFLTAHEEHALRAFETRAVDYLLKPVSRARLAEALDRVRERLARGAPSRRLAVRDAGQVTFVTVSEIDWVESAGNYAIVHAGARTHIVRETMGALEEFLAGDEFLRVSRGAIVNLAKVRELRTAGGAVAVLADGVEVLVKRPVREVAERLRLAGER